MFRCANTQTRIESRTSSATTTGGALLEALRLSEGLRSALRAWALPAPLRPALDLLAGVLYVLCLSALGTPLGFSRAVFDPLGSWRFGPKVLPPTQYVSYPAESCPGVVLSRHYGVKAGPEPTGSLPAVEIALVLGPVPMLRTTAPSGSPSGSSAEKAGGRCR